MNIPHCISQPRKTSSLLHHVKARNSYYERPSFYKPTTQHKFAFTPSNSEKIVIMNIPRFLSQPHRKVRL